jgi:hypothetical protein
MRQRRFAYRPERSIKSKTEEFERRELASARLILDEPESYGGLESGLCKWARVLVDRAGGRAHQSGFQFEGKPAVVGNGNPILANDNCGNR